jgi:peptide/nickel transport system permease protein
MKTFFKKISYLGIMLLIISMISFLAVKLAPNSFFASGNLNPNIDTQAIEQLKKIYNLDKPLYIQYISWLNNILHLNFGISFSSGIEVKQEILDRLPLTLKINLISMSLIFIISLFLGIKAAFNKDKLIDKFTKQLSVLSFAMPSFYLALILIYIFAIKLQWLPISGSQTYKHLILPISIIIFGGIGSLSLYIRNLAIEILKSDYIFFARARDINNFHILRLYIIPNLLPTVVTLLGLSLPSIFGGSVILETIFGINGMGLLFFNSALSHDYPVIMGILIIGAFLTLLGNMIADIILLKINPNFRLS